MMRPNGKDEPRKILLALLAALLIHFVVAYSIAVSGGLFASHCGGGRQANGIDLCRSCQTATDGDENKSDVHGYARFEKIG